MSVKLTRSMFMEGGEQRDDPPFRHSLLIITPMYLLQIGSRPQG